MIQVADLSSLFHEWGLWALNKIDLLEGKKKNNKP